MPLVDYDKPCVINWDDREPPKLETPVPQHVWKHLREMEIDQKTPKLRLNVPTSEPLVMCDMGIGDGPAQPEKSERKLPLEPGVKLFSCPSAPKAAAME